MGSAALADDATPGTIYGALACLCSCSLSWASHGLQRVRMLYRDLCIHANLFSAILSLRYRTLWRRTSEVAWLYLSLYSHSREPSGWMQGFWGSAGRSTLLCWINGLRWMWGLALSFKLSLQWRFSTVHFLAFLAAFQNTSCCILLLSLLLQWVGSTDYLFFYFFFFEFIPPWHYVFKNMNI